MMIKKVGDVTIPVKDQDKAVEFYTKCLGFEVVLDMPASDTQRWIELKIPGTETAIVLFTMEGHEDRIGTPSNIVFNCDDVNQTFDQLKKNGVTFVQEPTKESWGISALFSDVDGNVFCITSHATVTAN